MEEGDRQKSGEFREFRDTIRQSRALGEVRLVDTLQKAAHTDWRVAAWLLERLYPETYGKKVWHVMVAPEVKPITVIYPPTLALPRIPQKTIDV